MIELSSHTARLKNNKIQVLLIEDDQFDYQVVRRYLRSSPRVVLHHAEDIGQAIEHAQRTPFDCFILDWYLPDGDGEQFLSYAAAAMPWVPTIIMTSGMEDLLTSSALALGAQDYLLKGQFDGDSLRRSINFAIARKLAERERWTNIQSDRMSFVNQIVSGVAHEINNPIAWIGSNIDLLHDQFERGEVDTREGIELCQECGEGVERIADVVRVLRTYAEAGEQTMELCQVLPILDRALHKSEESHDGRVEVRVEAPPSLPRVLVNALGIEKALFQVILNAFQAATKRSENEGVKPRVEVHLSIADRLVVFDVFDSGPGLDVTIVEHVFDPFYSSQRQKRLGMGLAIAHDVVTNHRGAIKVRDEPSPLGGAWIQVKVPIM